MGTLKGSLGTTNTSQNWASIRTDDDIQAAVSQFLEEESVNLKEKSFSESIVDVARWLGFQIQKEREGWAFKVRMAMMEIETHRRETLKIQGLLQECTEQLRLLAGCSNIHDETLDKISEEKPFRALPMYIECLSALISDLMEDRLQCLHIMKKKETDGDSISQILHAYLHKLQQTNDSIKSDLLGKVTDLEMEVFKYSKESAKLKRVIAKKNEEIIDLQELLRRVDNQIEFDKIRKSNKTDATHETHERDPSPGSMKSAPTPVSIADSNHIQISEEKLHKLRKSAKKLESSLQDALTQMDDYRKGSTMKYSHASMISQGMRLKPLLTDGESEAESPRDKKTGAVQRSESTSRKKSKFEISGNAKQTAVQIKIKENKESLPTEQAKRTIKVSQSQDLTEHRRSEEREKLFVKNERIFPNQSQSSCTFKSLVRSLDEMRTRRNHKVKGGKVSKCLRCQKLFTMNDNHKKSCCFHPRSKERVEEYSDKGKLQRVTYVWQCCQQGADSQGCCYGKHI